MTAELYKIEVPDYGDEEINRMAVVYEALRGMPPKAQLRCVRWLSERLRSDHKIQPPQPNTELVKLMRSRSPWEPKP
jgi:hypothetical protein